MNRIPPANRKVVVVGVGAVGSTFACSLLHSGLAEQMALLDANMLNWDTVRKPASDGDEVLSAAIGRFDDEGVRQALESRPRPPSRGRMAT